MSRLEEDIVFRFTPKKNGKMRSRYMDRDILEQIKCVQFKYHQTKTLSKRFKS